MGNGLQHFRFPVPGSIDFIALAPILAVVVTGILALIAEMAAPKRKNDWPVGISLLGLLFAGAVAFIQLGYDDSDTLNRLFVRDRFGVVMQLLLITACFLTVMFSESYLREKRVPFGEFYPLILWSTAGAMMMVTTTNLLVIFLGLELLSISLYVMAGLSRREQKSEESALKYFLLGSFASGFLLYGIALFYGASGGTALEGLSGAWATGDQTARLLILFGLGFAMVGMFFKAAFVPFHQWTPDVYQGAPTNVTAFMAAGSKIAAIAVLFRVLDASALLTEYWFPVVAAVAILTMTVGNIVALVQKDVKRILGYSSIAHAGYILVAILAHAKDPTHVQFATVAFYLLAYSLMTIGAFAVVSLAAKGGKEGTRLEDLHGLWGRAPFAAGILVLFLVSLVGIPPTIGFFGKLYIFMDALNSGLTYLAVILALNSVVSVAYYLSIARAAFVADDEPGTRSAPTSLGLVGTCTLCGLGVLFAGLFASSFLGWCAVPTEGDPYRSVKPLEPVAAVHRGRGRSPAAAVEQPDAGGQDGSSLP